MIYIMWVLVLISSVYGTVMAVKAYKTREHHYGMVSIVLFVYALIVAYLTININNIGC